MNSIMNDIRARSILVLLCTYPLFAYFIRIQFGITPSSAAGMVGFILMLEVVITKFRNNENLILPKYLLALLGFSFYVLASKIFLTNEMYSVSLPEYMIREPFFKSFAFIFVLENTKFRRSDITWATHFLFFSLIAAAIVTLIQIKEPFFFRREALFAKGMSFDRMQNMLSSFTEEEYRELRFINKGYRFSIYSWITGISVGIDSIAVLSLLLGIKSIGQVRRLTLLACGGIISILSSSRWIMLNYILVLSQTMIDRTNRLFCGLKVGALLVITVLAVGLGASYLGVNLDTFFTDRLMSDSANTRIYAFEVFGKVFHEAPVFGTAGQDTEEVLKRIQGRTSQIHVGWLKILYYYGIVGTFIYLIFIGFLLKHLYDQARVTRYWGSLFAFLAFVLANCTLVEFSVFYYGLFLALIFNRYIDNRTPEQISKPAPMLRARQMTTPRHKSTLEI